MKRFSAAKWVRRPLCAFCMLVLLVQFFRVAVLENTRDQRSTEAESALADGEEVLVSGVVRKVQEKESVTAVVLSGCTLSSGTETISENKILLYLTGTDGEEELKIGSVLCVQGKKDSFSEARNEGNFDQKLYYRRQGIHILLWAEEIQSCTASAAGAKKLLFALQNRLQDLKETWADMLAESLGSYYGETIKAVLLGDKSGLDEDVQTLYRTNGVGHILAISGLHMSFIGLGVYRAGRRLGLKPAPAGAASAVILFLYYLMVGPGVSGTRALFMFLFRMGADVTGRDYDLPTALAVSAAVSAVRQPLILTDAGFLLSYGAILGLYLFLPVFTAVFGKDPQKGQELRAGSAGRRFGKGTGILSRFAAKVQDSCLTKAFSALGEKARSALCASLSVSIFLLGPLLWFYFETPLYSVFLNILVIPLMPPAMAAGICGLVLGLIFPAAGSKILQICRGILMLCDALCSAASALPAYRMVTGRQSIPWIVCYYTVLAVVLLWHRQEISSKKKEIQSDAGRPLTARKRAPGIFAVLFMLFMIFACRLGNQFGGGVETTFLDVGQGDCICIRGPSGSTYLVDGGSTDVSDAGTWRIKPYLLANGIDTLDYVFATHGDEDHISGIEELLAGQDTGVKIKNLVLPSETYIDDNLAALAALAVQNGTRVVTMNPGEQITEIRNGIGAGSKSGNAHGDADNALVITCLGPQSGAGLESGNEASLVLDVTYGDFSMLLAGDVEEDGEVNLIASPLLQTYDVYKVAHHGSKYTSSVELLEAISPSVSVISCGADNIYGHPHEETLERLEAVGSKVFVTMESAQIRVLLKDGSGKMSVSAFISGG